MASNDAASSVQVAIRVRPLLAYEAGTTKCIEILHSKAKLYPNIVRIGGESGPTFAFDEAFDGSTLQQTVFSHQVEPLVGSCLEGYNATVLAYGQTGSGKTHTIMGPDTALQDGETAGVIPRALASLFEKLEDQKTEATPEKRDDTLEYDFEVRVQFLEIYGEQIRDLLTPKKTSNKLSIRDVGMEEPEVLGATQHKVSSAEDALLCLTRGMLRRVTGETAMNASSSRSHAILSVMVEQTTTSADGVAGVKRSKFNFVDLAGSERQKRTKAEGQRLKEGIDINKGLLVLGNVISALGDPKKRGKTFVPYRDSKLTRLLKGSLGGNHKTLMVACVSPSSSNLEESLNCLRYANRAKNIQNNAVVNVDPGTRLVAELKGKVTALAKEMLRMRDGENPNEATFPISELQKLAAGQEGSIASEYGQTPMTPTRQSVINPQTPRSSNTRKSRENGRINDDLGEREVELESELKRTKDMLAKTSKELQTTTEDLFVVRAEKETYRLRSMHGADGTMEAAFTERAKAYEAEIATLKEAVQARPSYDPATTGVLQQASQSLSKEKAQLEDMKSRLAQISPEKAQRNDAYEDGDDSPELTRLKSRVYASISHTDQIEAEEKAEQAEISAITEKYLEDDENIEREKLNETTGSSEAKLAAETKELEVSLSHLSHSIQEKEGLIEQLQLSEEKYANMREYYQDKLQEMEDQVREKEAEHAEILRELKKLEEGNKNTSELKKRLQEKESHIAGLRRRQGELERLTKVSSRTEVEMARLKEEVVNMKQRKVELQKLITSERKSHTGEIKRLRKEIAQSDRETSKWKKMSDRKAMEAEKAQQVAKQRLEQLGQLKTKYKEAERKLRVRTVKRGVMEKAGLDPVMVGRRNTATRGSVKQSKTKEGGFPKSPIDVDSIRDFFDQKVADIGRKEALADKLANEWEDHLMLAAQKEGLLEKIASGDRDVHPEAVEGLDVQLKYKQDRIRQLAQRLGKHPGGKPKGDHSKETFLDDSKLLALFKGSSSTETARLSSRILFGMVVRERRRVAALARTASALDEKAVGAEKKAASIDAAFRSYMEEQRTERATLIQSHQEQILSLMEIVKDEEKQEAFFPHLEVSPQNSPDAFSDISKASSVQSSRVMILANERLEALERQLQELEDERDSKDMYKAKEEKTSAELAAKKEECHSLQKELNQVRASLRQVREVITQRSLDEDFDGNELGQSVLTIVMNGLHPSRPGSPQKRRTTPLKENSSGIPKPTRISPRVRRHVELMHTSDSEEDEEIPEWAGDIMADLAVIASGNIPDALLKSASFNNQSEELNQGSVFDRLTNPQNFTGVQKSRSSTPKRPIKEKQRKPVSKPTKPNEDKKRLRVNASDQTRKQLEASFDDRKREDKKRRSAEQDPKVQGRSVFERLLSPSMYTGTQKEKMQSVQAKKSQQAEKMLDDLLASDVDSSVNMDAPDSDKEENAPIHQPPEVSKKVSDYTQQNVFERLQRTTTHSYAEKKKPAGKTFTSPMKSSIGTEADLGVAMNHSDTNKLSSSPPKDSDYVKQNVFERLQKTTTKAFAKKTSLGNTGL